MIFSYKTTRDCPAEEYKMDQPMSGSPDGIDQEGWQRALVTNNVDPRGQGRIYVTIPKQQPDAVPGEEATPADKKQKLDKQVVNNSQDNSYDDEVLQVNCYLARPTWIMEASSDEKSVNNEIKKDKGYQTIKTGKMLQGYVPGTGSYVVPRIGTWVFVFFEDGDPKKCYWLPFGPTLDGEVTPMKHMEQVDNAGKMEKRVNVRVFWELPNGNIFYADMNEDRDCVTLKFPSGHRIRMQEAPDRSSVTVETASGHQFKMVDKSLGDGAENKTNNNNVDGVTGGTFIHVETAGGHELLMDDNPGKEKILMKTSSGHIVLMDEVANSIHVETKDRTIQHMEQGDEIRQYTGSKIVSVSGGSTMEASADNMEKVVGGDSMEAVAGKMQKMSAGPMQLFAPSIALVSTGGDATWTSVGGWKIHATQPVQITSDVSITLQAPAVNLNPGIAVPPSFIDLPSIPEVPAKPGRSAAAVSRP